MKILITFDYELFFGSNSGTVENCMLQPTRDLLELAENKEVAYTFFVDVGYLLAAEKVVELKEEVERVEQQLKELVVKGHDLQLHVHPHWEKAVWENGNWTMNTRNAYKLSDFSVSDAAEIIKRYKLKLEAVKGGEVKAFRAGGWCVQPFEHIRDALKDVGITVDSSVIPGFYMFTNDYAVNFYNAPQRTRYTFESDVCLERPDGAFTELPIMSYRYNPLFYWSLYLRGKLNPGRHKMIGDGTFISHGSRKWKQLLMYTDMHISTDGYYARKLSAGLEKATYLGFEEMVVIGHPKGNTEYSLQKLGEFIDKNCERHQFVAFNSVI